MLRAAPYDATGAGQFAVASTGNLAWVRGPLVAYSDRVLVSVDRHGQVSRLAAPVKSYGLAVRLGPGGRQLAVSVQSLSAVSLWTQDLARGTLTPLVQSGEAEFPVWTPDGQRLVFGWLKDGRLSLAWHNAPTGPRRRRSWRRGASRPRRGPPTAAISP